MAAAAVRPMYLGEEVAGAVVVAAEVHRRLRSVEEVGEGEVRVVWFVGAVEGEEEEVWGLGVPRTEGEVVGAVRSAEVEVQESTYSAVAG